jgi:hypothetical protein
MKRILVLLAFAVASASAAQAQNNVGINTTPAASAALDVSFPAGTPQGMLVPRMTQTQRTTGIASPATGLIVYQTDGVTGFYYYSGTAWVLLRDAVNSYPNVELSVANTTQQSITSTIISSTFNTLTLSSTNNTSALLTGGNTWNGTTFTVGTGGAGWYQVTGNFVGVASGSNATSNNGYQVVADKNGSFGTSPAANIYPLGFSTYNSTLNSSFLKNLSTLQLVVYLATGDYLNFRAQAYSNSAAAYTSTDGSTNLQIVRIK